MALWICTRWMWLILYAVEPSNGAIYKSVRCLFASVLFCHRFVFISIYRSVFVLSPSLTLAMCVCVCPACWGAALTQTHTHTQTLNTVALLLRDRNSGVLHHICWLANVVRQQQRDAVHVLFYPTWWLFIVFCLRLNAKLKIAPCHAMMIPYGTHNVAVSRARP